MCLLLVARRGKFPNSILQYIQILPVCGVLPDTTYIRSAPDGHDGLLLLLRSIIYIYTYTHDDRLLSGTRNLLTRSPKIKIYIGGKHVRFLCQILSAKTSLPKNYERVRSLHALPLSLVFSHFWGVLVPHVSVIFVQVRALHRRHGHIPGTCLLTTPIWPDKFLKHLVTYIRIEMAFFTKVRAYTSSCCNNELIPRSCSLRKT